MNKKTLDVIILIGRPASGKSEIIDFLKRLDSVDRLANYHIAEMDVLDDFPMLWTWFEEDHILANVLREPRLHTDDRGFFLHSYFWNLLIERLCLEYGKRLRDDPDYHSRFTSVIEFSRGSEHGGYKQAFKHMSEAILNKAGVLYVNVPFEESLRKNRRRANPQKPDSILEHSLSDEKLERLYRYDDWIDFCGKDPDFLSIRGNRIPYAVFENADDVTTGKPLQLARRLEDVLERLLELRRST